MTKQVDINRRLFRPTYENDWIEEGLSKHKANYSMVICFETDDPTRFEQLKNFLLSSPPDEYKSHKIYIYNPWDGLRTINKGEITSYVFHEGKRYQKELQDSNIVDLHQALRVVDPKLKKEKSILIIHNLSPDIKGKEYLLSALKSWANSPHLINNRSLVVIFGGSLSSLIDEETKELLALVEVNAGKESEYEKLIDYLSNINGLPLDTQEKEILKSVLKGLNLHQAEAILRESYAKTHRFDLEEIKALKEDVVKKTGILEIKEPQEGFEVIGGYEPIKNFIRQKIIKVLHNPELARKFAIPIPRGILLFGPPGTGKTLFAKALSKEIKLPFLNFKTENIYSRWLGESGQRLRKAIKVAEQIAPAIVFIDEIDRFGKRTQAGDPAGEETRRVFSQLLEWLGDKNRKAIVIGTTNIPEDLDEAFLRTGRFDYKIPVLYPDEDARLEILKIHLGLPDKQGKPAKPKPPLSLPDEKFIEFLKKEIVPKTKNFTGAELEELVIRVKRNAFEREGEKVNEEDFYKSLESFRINEEERERQLEKYQELAKKYTDDATFLTHLMK